MPHAHPHRPVRHSASVRRRIVGDAHYPRPVTLVPATCYPVIFAGSRTQNFRLKSDCSTIELLVDPARLSDISVSVQAATCYIIVNGHSLAARWCAPSTTVMRTPRLNTTSL